jgi:hypothetical protein
LLSRHAGLTQLLKLECYSILCCFLKKVLSLTDNSGPYGLLFF